jgi:hypothetical protein
MRSLRGLLGTVLFLFFSVYLASDVQYSLKEAQKVFQIIEDIQIAQMNGRMITERIVLSESELNSYIAYRIETEKEEVMKELSLKLFEGNRIEGKILIDLRGQNLPKFLRPEMNLFFAAKLKILNDKVRLVDRKMFLEGQRIQPMVIDVIIEIASRMQNEEPSSMGDWYDLPYGIKNIKTQQGKAMFYFSKRKKSP